MARRKFIQDESSAQPVAPGEYEEGYSWRQKRRAKKEARKAYDEARAEMYSKAKEKGYKTKEERMLEGRERVLALRKREAELRKQEREVSHPIRTRAIRRAEKMGATFLSQGEQVAQNVPKEGGRQLRRAISRQRPVRIRSGFTEGAPSGRVRLPVFAEGSPGFAERVAMDFGAKAPQDILTPSQPQEFFSSKSSELFGNGKQMDLGLGSNNKKKVRYY